MTEKRVKIKTGKQGVDGIWVDSLYDSGSGYAVVIDGDGDVHMVSFRSITVLP